MEKRLFGRTGHMSTVAIFGAAGLSTVSQDVADIAMERIIAAGVNHIDIAPSYGEAELRVGPWMPRIRADFFLGCKTTERNADNARAEMERSLTRLNVSTFGLYQLHAVTSFEELDMCTRPGGALEAVIQARSEGLTKHIGITGHGNQSPAVFLEALRRFDFDTVLFPINPVQMGNPEYRANAEDLIATCQEKNVGTMIIKAVAKQPWKDQERVYDTWYEPYDLLPKIQEGVNFALSHAVTGLCTAGDVNILPLFLEACQNFSPLDAGERESLIQDQSIYETIFSD
jgi:aryl-alcohol dehydrogenase-like predicted oxidoreductase